MLKPLMLSIGLIVALTSCSKRDDETSSQMTAPPVRTAEPSKDASASNDTAGNGASSALVAQSKPKSLSTAEAATTSSDSGASGQKKQTDVMPKKEKKREASQGTAKSGRSPIVKRWDEFQATVDVCAAAPAVDREQCLTEARHAFRSANFQCDTLPARERKNCLQFAERWNGAGADAQTTEQAPSDVVKHDDEPMTMPAHPADTGPAERNRDSTKQSQDAVGTASDDTEPN